MKAGELKSPAIPSDAERSYGPTITASNPLTFIMEVRFSTASLFSICAIIRGFCASFL